MYIYIYIYEAMCALYTFRFSLALSGSPEPFSLFHQWVLLIKLFLKTSHKLESLVNSAICVLITGLVPVYNNLYI